MRIMKNKIILLSPACIGLVLGLLVISFAAYSLLKPTVYIDRALQMSYALRAVR